ncbi:NADP+-dependent D-mannitol dehydrogenase [Crucibulum laeve]|uniref:NADP+-dependent D-mannitol dehydrogenase n=1 Tax=Crucibulum laeve TaxID=68775 RepID=A0A5C3M853_9AGAR|nr:NADP+-dependent D-mannitol dehydrogenase [Crucibulum laeve]
MTAKMNSVCYHAPGQMSIIQTDIPKIDDNQVLVKVTCCGICGSDVGICSGGFGVKFPLIPGHEIIGIVSQVGALVKDFVVGDRCAVDNIINCEACFFCRRNQPIQCTNIKIIGVHLPGAFTEYIAVSAKMVYKIGGISDEEAIFIEPISCAIHGVDRLGSLVPGMNALVIGAGVHGIVLSQLLKLNGASCVTLAANRGKKMDIARQVNAADVYVEFDRADPTSQWTSLKEENPLGFEVVIDATGSAKVVNDALDFVRSGGTLLLYGLYSDDAMVQWSPTKIFANEIKVIGSFGQKHCFSRALEYLQRNKINVKGLVTDVFPINDFNNAMDKVGTKDCCKIVIKPSL